MSTKILNFDKYLENRKHEKKNDSLFYSTIDKFSSDTDQNFLR